MTFTVSELIQKLNLDYFSLYRLKPAFEIDLAQLKSRFYELQSQYHPDKAHHDSEEIKSLVELLSIKINDSYQILLSPLKRAILLLNMLGIDVDLTKQTKLPPEFLQKYMEIHERIEEAKLSNQEEELELLSKEILNEIDILVKKLEKSFAKGSLALLNGDYQFEAGEIDEIIEQIKQLSFLTKLNDMLIQIIGNL